MCEKVNKANEFYAACLNETLSAKSKCMSMVYQMLYLIICFLKSLTNFHN